MLYAAQVYLVGGTDNVVYEGRQNISVRDIIFQVATGGGENNILSRGQTN